MALVKLNLDGNQLVPKTIPGFSNHISVHQLTSIGCCVCETFRFTNVLHGGQIWTSYRQEATSLGGLNIARVRVTMVFLQQSSKSQTLKRSQTEKQQLAIKIKKTDFVPGILVLFSLQRIHPRDTPTYITYTETHEKLPERHLKTKPRRADIERMQHTH